MSTEAGWGARAVRWFTLVRGGYGAALLCAPGPLARLAGGCPAGARERAVARVLGIRHVTQAALTAGAASPAALAVGTGTDLAHAASMLGLALSGRRWRRAALLDASVAAALATAGMLAARLAGSPVWRYATSAPERTRHDAGNAGEEDSG